MIPQARAAYTRCSSASRELFQGELAHRLARTRTRRMQKNHSRARRFDLAFADGNNGKLRVKNVSAGCTVNEEEND